jgi:heme o synthase
MNEPTALLDPAITVAPEAALRDWFVLLKPRVLTLVVFTGVIGLLVAPGHLHPVLGFTAVLCITVAAGAAGAINMWYDRDIDRVMRRTASRPLPAGRMLPGEALGFGCVLGVGSVAVMGVAVNWVAAELLALTIAFYVFVYTMWLKRRTPQNIVIGGAAGAVPVLVGSVIATGRVGWLAVVLFAIVFFWTPPHSWALSLVYRRDYAGADVPMLPTIASERATLRAILAYLVVLVGVSLLPAFALGFAYAIPVAGLNAYYLVLAVRTLRASSVRGAARLFHYSLVYLAAVFALCAATALLGG